MSEAPMKGTILLVDDDPSLCELLGRRLNAHGFDCSTCPTAADALEYLRGTRPIDALVTDIRLRGESGLVLCTSARTLRPDVPVVMITGDDDPEAPVGALRAGAFDFIRKPIDLSELASTLERALRQYRLEEHVRQLPRTWNEGARPHGILGNSSAIREVCALLERVATVDSSVLITGENGTGKELVARALHEQSHRRAGPFVAVNCAAIPESLIESELFGHVRGAFTDARIDRKGLFLQAAGGTLFLDELADLPVRVQAKLLRVLQERVLRPVGSDRDQTVDFRLVAATNRNLTQAIAEGSFREDLFYRVGVIHVVLPPLRARGEDTLQLAQSFVERFAKSMGKPIIGLTSASAEALLSYPWPGNVRELQNSIEHAVALTPFDRITVDDLPERMRGYDRRAPTSSPLMTDDAPPGPAVVPLGEIERRHIAAVLASAGGNKTEAARLLGMSRRTLHRKIASGELESQMTLRQEKETRKAQA